MLAEYLEIQRRVLAWKCEGLSEAQLKEASVPPSNLTLLGLVRHMAEVERFWFRRGLVAEEIGPIWNSDAEPDAVFVNAADADVAEAFSSWQAECRASRRIFEQLDTLDRTFSTRHSAGVSARSMVNHMIEEYSRHNGHADLLRERIDGQTGDFPPDV